MFFPGGLLQLGFPFEQTMFCHILFMKKMAYSPSTDYTIARSQYHQENKAPLCPKHQRFCLGKGPQIYKPWNIFYLSVKLIRFFHLRILMPSGDRTLETRIGESFSASYMTYQKPFTEGLADVGGALE